jgi:hypothetical protein
VETVGQGFWLNQLSIKHLLTAAVLLVIGQSRSPSNWVSFVFPEPVSLPWLWHHYNLLYIIRSIVGWGRQLPAHYLWITLAPLNVLIWGPVNIIVFRIDKWAGNL